MPTAFSTRRLMAVTAILFLLIFAFLAGRVHAGADPTQAATPASSTVRGDPTPAPSTADTPSGDGGFGDPGGAYDDGSGSSGGDPSSSPDDGYGASGADPYSSPDGSVPPGLAPDPDPPTTSAS